MRPFNLHPQIRPKNQGRLRGSFKALEPFLFLGLIRRENTWVTGPFPRCCFRFGPSDSRQYVGYLLPLSGCSDPDMAEALVRLQEGASWSNPAFRTERDADEPGFVRVLPEAGFIEFLSRHCQVLSLAAQTLEDEVAPMGTESLAWGSWLEVENMLLQVVPEGDDRRWEFLEAALVFDWEAARTCLYSMSLEKALPYRLLPVTGEVDSGTSDLRVRFKDHGFGWVYLHIRIHGRYHQIPLSDVYDPMMDIVEWLEACLDETKPALLAIDPEGGVEFLALRPTEIPGMAVFQHLKNYRDKPQGQAEVHRLNFVRTFLASMHYFLKYVLDLEGWSGALQPYFHKWSGPDEGRCYKECSSAYRRDLLQRIRQVQGRISSVITPL